MSRIEARRRHKSARRYNHIFCGLIVRSRGLYVAPVASVAGVA